MSCLNNQRMKDINHVRALAKQFSNVTEQNVDIVKTNRSGVGEVYDFILSANNKQEAVETIAYVRVDHSESVLSDHENERVQPTSIEQTKKSKRKPTVQSVDGDTGNILPEDRPD